MLVELQILGRVLQSCSRVLAAWQGFGGVAVFWQSCAGLQSFGRVAEFCRVAAVLQCFGILVEFRQGVGGCAEFCPGVEY